MESDLTQDRRELPEKGDWSSRERLHGDLLRAADHWHLLREPCYGGEENHE